MPSAPPAVFTPPTLSPSAPDAVFTPGSSSPSAPDAVFTPSSSSPSAPLAVFTPSSSAPDEPLAVFIPESSAPDAPHAVFTPESSTPDAPDAIFTPESSTPDAPDAIFDGDAGGSPSSPAAVYSASMAAALGWRITGITHDGDPIELVLRPAGQSADRVAFSTDGNPSTGPGTVYPYALLQWDPDETRWSLSYDQDITGTSVSNWKNETNSLLPEEGEWVANTGLSGGVPIFTAEFTEPGAPAAVFSVSGGTPSAPLAVFTPSSSSPSAPLAVFSAPSVSVTEPLAVFTPSNSSPSAPPEIYAGSGAGALGEPPSIHADAGWAGNRPAAIWLTPETGSEILDTNDTPIRNTNDEPLLNTDA